MSMSYSSERDFAIQFRGAWLCYSLRFDSSWTEWISDVTHWPVREESQFAGEFLSSIRNKLEHWENEGIVAA